jgi:hypothetical protein
MLTLLITAYFTLVVLLEMLIVLFVILFGLCVIVKILEYFLKKLANFKNRVPKA